MVLYVSFIINIRDDVGDQKKKEGALKPTASIDQFLFFSTVWESDGTTHSRHNNTEKKRRGQTWRKKKNQRPSITVEEELKAIGLEQKPKKILSFFFFLIIQTPAAGSGRRLRQVFFFLLFSLRYTWNRTIARSSFLFLSVRLILTGVGPSFYSCLPPLVC